MNVAIIGAGLIGRKRANALPKGVNLSTVCDTDQQKAKELARDFKCESETNWRNVTSDPKIQAVIIATINKYLSPIAQEAISFGKHILVEKPGARNLREFEKIARVYKKKTVLVFGYNHRYHPGIVIAKKIVDSKKIRKYSVH